MKRGLNRKFLFQLVSFLLVGFAAVFMYLNYESFFSPLENKLNDMMLKTRGEKKPDKNIVIVDIDEKSLKELGQWPWSRDIFAKILQNLTDYGVGIMGLI